MATELIQYTATDIQLMARNIAESKLFGVMNAQQAMALMLISQAEGRHPALAARDYDIIQNKPSKKAEAMLRDFIASGGKVEWLTLDDKAASATFSHPQGGTVRIDWDMARALQAGLGGKDMWKKYPRQMLRSRCVSEGVKTVCPAATSGFYTPEEVRDFDGDKPMVDVTPKPVQHPIDEAAIKLEGEAQNAAAYGSASLVAFLKGLDKDAKAKLLAKHGTDLKTTAKKADEERAAAEADNAGTHEDELTQGEA